MTIKEFNTKYKDYLEAGHYGLAIDIPEVIEYLDKEFQELIKVPGFKYSQIKMKFDWARFYCDEISVGEVSKIEREIEKIIGKKLDCNNHED